MKNYKKIVIGHKYLANLLKKGLPPCVAEGKVCVKHAENINKENCAAELDCLRSNTCAKDVEKSFKIM